MCVIWSSHRGGVCESDPFQGKRSWKEGTSSDLIPLCQVKVHLELIFRQLQVLRNFLASKGSLPMNVVSCAMEDVQVEVRGENGAYYAVSYLLWSTLCNRITFYVLFPCRRTSVTSLMMASSLCLLRISKFLSSRVGCLCCHFLFLDCIRI